MSAENKKLDMNEVCIGHSYKIKPLVDLPRVIMLAKKAFLYPTPSSTLSQNEHPNLVKFDSKVQPLTSEQQHESASTSINASTKKNDKQQTTKAKMVDHRNNIIAEKFNNKTTTENKLTKAMNLVDKTSPDQSPVTLYLVPAVNRDLAFLREIILEAAECGDNVGMDEYEDTPEGWESFFTIPEIFAARELLTRKNRRSSSRDVMKETPVVHNHGNRRESVRSTNVKSGKTTDKNKEVIIPGSLGKKLVTNKIADGKVAQSLVRNSKTDKNLKHKNKDNEKNDKTNSNNNDDIGSNDIKPDKIKDDKVKGKYKNSLISSGGTDNITHFRKRLNSTRLENNKIASKNQPVITPIISNRINKDLKYSTPVKGHEIIRSARTSIVKNMMKTNDFFQANKKPNNNNIVEKGEDIINNVTSVVDTAANKIIGPNDKIISNTIKSRKISVQISDLSKETKVNSNRTSRDGDLFSEPQVFVLIYPCMTSRTFDTCLTNILIFYRQELTNRVDKELIYTTFLEEAFHLIKELDLKYTNCVLRICPETNRDRVDILREKGFTISVPIPDAVNIGGYLKTDYIMTKSFEPPRERRQQTEILETINRICPPEENDPIFFSSALTPLPFLPRIYRTPQSGLLVLIRNARHEDDKLIYGLMKDAAEKGSGYGADEFPTLSAFRMWMMLDRYCYVYENLEDPNQEKDGINLEYLKKIDSKGNELSEEIRNNRLIGCTIAGDSYFTRSKMSRAWESNLIINPLYRGMRVGSDIVNLEKNIMKQMGYSWGINDVLAGNERMQKTLMRSFGPENHIRLGIIPRASFTIGVGWEDQLVYRFTIDPSIVKSFDEVVEESEKKWAATAKEKLTDLTNFSSLIRSKL